LFVTSYNVPLMLNLSEVNAHRHLGRVLLAVNAGLLVATVTLSFGLWGTRAPAPAAVAPLTAGSIAALASVTALLLKQGSEEAALELQKVINEGAESRMRVEAIAQAASLVGADSTSVQKAAAMMTLVRLGEHGLAISLLYELWPDSLTTDAAVWTLDRCLQPDVEDFVQVRAASCLLLHVEELDQQRGSGPVLPACFWSWDPRLASNAKFVLVEVVAGLVPRHQNIRTWAKLVLVLWRAVLDPDVTGEAASLLDVLLESRSGIRFQVDGEMVTVESMRAAIEHEMSRAELSDHWKGILATLRDEHADRLSFD